MVVAVVLLMALTGALASETGPFTLAILPDTQYYVWTNSPRVHLFRAQTQWIASNAAARNIRFVLHVGDIVQNTPPALGANALEWQWARECMQVLDGVVPYVVALGNHDYYGDRNTTNFNATFPVAHYAQYPWFGGVATAGRSENAYFYMRAGGLDWLILSLEYGPRNGIVDWANYIVASHSNHSVIVLTHTFLYNDNSLHGSSTAHQWNPHDSTHNVNDGLELWDKFVRRHPNIRLVFNGHVHGVGSNVFTGDYGNAVVCVLANYQQEANGGNGYMRLVTLDPTARTIRVETYSPWLNQYRRDPSNDFVLTDIPFFDEGVPDPPTGLQAMALGPRSARLIWSPPAAGPAASRYAVYRNGARVGIVADTSYTDNALREATGYRYEVRSIGRNGKVSSSGAVAYLGTPLDTSPPAVRQVAATHVSNQVAVVFDEPVDIASLSPANFFISRRVVVSEVTRGADTNTVVLRTSGLAPSNRHRVWVMNVSDVSSRSNKLARSQPYFVEFFPPLLQETFDDPSLSHWVVVNEGTANHYYNRPGAWFVSDGVLHQTNYNFGPEWGTVRGRRGTYLLYNGPGAREWSNYAVQATIRATFDGGIGLMFRYQNASNYYKFESENRNMFKILSKVVNGRETLLAWDWSRHPLHTNLVFRIEADGSRLVVKINGQNIFPAPVEDTSLSKGTIALYTWKCSAVFDDVLVTRMPPPLEAGDEDALQDEEFEISASVEGLNTEPSEGGEGGNDGGDVGGQPPRAEGGEVPSPGAPEIILRWTSIPGRHYAVLRTEDLLQPFSAIASNLPATPPTNTFRDRLINEQVFYRIAEKLSPP